MIQTLRAVRVACIAVAALAVALPALAVETKVVRDDTFEELRQGESTGTEILAEGRLRVAPEMKRLFQSGEGVSWGAAIDRKDGSIFLVTGNSGKVLRWTPNGKSELWADLSEVQAMSVAIDATGGVLVGAAPGGKIYRIVEPGKPKLFFETGEAYVWAMIIDREGVLYAATGPNGKVFRIRGERNGEVFYDSDATNVLSLGFTPDGKLVASTQGKGFVLRVDAPNKGYVMYASPDDECRSLTVDAQGNIYVAVNGFRGGAPPPQPSGTSAAEPKSGSAASPTAGSIAGITAADRGIAGVVLPTPSGGPGATSRVMRIQPNGFVSDFWDCPEGPIRALLADPASGSVIVAAGDAGRIYRLLNDSTYSKLSDVPEPMVTSLNLHEGRILATTAQKAAIYELQVAPRPQGLYQSRVLNAGSTVKWGNLRIDCDPPTSTPVLKLETRSGNTPDPRDGTWSEWLDATSAAPGIAAVQSPVAQYLQYRLTLAGQGSRIDAVNVFYVEQNVPPLFSTIAVEKAGRKAATPPARRTTTAPTSTPATSGSSSGTSSDPIAAIARAVSRSAQSAEARKAPEPADKTDGDEVAVTTNQKKLELRWEAKDPNSDTLKYQLEFKADDETRWRTVEENIRENKFTVPTEFVADGEYRFRVIASDAPANPDDSATSASITSQIVVIDNTAPVIASLAVTKTASGEYEVTATVRDETSLLSSAEFVIDVEESPRVAVPVDGLFDLREETFKFRVRPDKPGDAHVLTFRAFDAEGNAAVARRILP